MDALALASHMKSALVCHAQLEIDGEMLARARKHHSTLPTLAKDKILIESARHLEVEFTKPSNGRPPVGVEIRVVFDDERDIRAPLSEQDTAARPDHREGLNMKSSISDRGHYTASTPIEAIIRAQRILLSDLRMEHLKLLTQGTLDGAARVTLLRTLDSAVLRCAQSSTHHFLPSRPTRR
jgi:hypothetical protein